MIANAYLNDSPWPIDVFDKTRHATLTDWMMRVVGTQFASPTYHEGDGSWTDGENTLHFVGTYLGPDHKLTSKPLRLNGSFVR